MREFGSVLFVDYEAAFVVDFEADVFETETGGVGAAADGYEDDVCIELVGMVSLDALDGVDGLQFLPFRLLRLRL